jgi:hypothetical protein
VVEADLKNCRGKRMGLSIKRFVSVVILTSNELMVLKGGRTSDVGSANGPRLTTVGGGAVKKVATESGAGGNYIRILSFKNLHRKHFPGIILCLITQNRFKVKNYSC